MLSRDASLAGRKESIAAAREASSGATKHTLGLTAHHAETHFVNLEAVIREIDGTLSMIVVSVMPPHSTAEQSRAEHCTALHCAVWLAMNAAAGTQHSTAQHSTAIQCRAQCVYGRPEGCADDFVLALSLYLRHLQAQRNGTTRQLMLHKLDSVAHSVCAHS